MAKRLLNACVAALGLAACQREPSPTPPRAPLRSPQASSVAAASLTESSLTASSLTASSGTASSGTVRGPPAFPPLPAPEVAGVDASPPEPARDGLGEAHAHRGSVDHLGRARGLQAEADLGGALAELQRAVQDAPWDEEVLRALAETARRAARHTLAAGAYERLARVRPTDAVPLVQQARCLLATGDASAALRAGAEALARDPENPEVYQVLGRAHLVEGDLSLAITRLERAVELAPEHGHALNNLGFAYLRANENGRAVEVLGRAAALLPGVAHVHNNLGVALERTGRTEQARDAFALATRLSPRDVKARVNSERMRRLASASMPSLEPLSGPEEPGPEEPGLEQERVSRGDE